MSAGASRRAAACFLAVAAAPPMSYGTEGPVLAAPHQDLAEVVPLRILDEIELPPATATPKVASKPTLSWRPGLSEPSGIPTVDAAPKATPQPTRSETKPQPPQQATKPAEPAPQLKPVAEAPMLVAPNAAEEESPQAEATDERPESIKAADAPVLPLRAPRSVKPAEEPLPKEPPAETKAPAAEAPRAEEPVAEEPAPQKEETPEASPRSRAAAPAVAPPRPTEPLPPLSRSMRNLRSRMRTVLSFYYRKPLNTAENDPWELMHSMLSYELHSRVRDGGPNGPFMTAVGHLCFNRASKRQQMMVINKEGKLDVEVGVGLQGHKGQFLAMLAQCNVSPDYPIRVDGKDFTIHDLIEAEQRTCYAKTELTFKLIGLGHYLASDASWVNDQGETWDIPRLIKEEREQPIRGAACGGTHRLGGLSLAFRRREARGEPVDGEYAEAAKFIRQYQAYAFQLQNEDGSLSTEWFRGRGAEEDIDRRLRTTGHLLEWLVYSLPDDQLQSYRTVRAVNYLTELLASNADHDWHLGSIGHAIHALVLYDKRVFRPHDADATDPVIAAVDPTGKLYRSYPIYRGVMRNSPPQSSGFLGLFGPSRTTSNRR